MWNHVQGQNMNEFKKMIGVWGKKHKKHNKSILISDKTFPYLDREMCATSQY